MIYASKLKKTNICEYLLYMWQIEDLIRAFGLNIDLIDKNIIAGMPLKNEAEKKTVYEWYESLIEMMRAEDVVQTGHLQLNKNVIIDLEDFHLELMTSGEEPAYNAKFIHILPLLNQLRKKSEAGVGDIELCFNFQYGFMLLKMKKAEISKETLQGQAEISKLMVLLARYYHAQRD